MPQLVLESLFCAGESNSKVTCETAFSGSGYYSDTEEGCDPDPYAPAESLWLRIGEDIDWSDVRAVLERDDSTKGASNPKSATRKSTAAAAAAWSSCAATGAPKAVAVVIGGLPTAGKTAREHGRRRSCRLGHEKESAGVAVEEEPASPKVSCLGVVRSQPGLEPTEAGRRAWWACFLVAAVRCCRNPCRWKGGREGARERGHLACTQAAEVKARTPANARHYDIVKAAESVLLGNHVCVVEYAWLVMHFQASAT